MREMAELKLYHYSTFHSYARDLTCLLDELNVTNSIYVGHSMSAMIGCIAATQKPYLFKHLILLSGSPRYLNANGYVGGFDRRDIESILHDIKYNFSSWVPTFAPKAVGVDDLKAIHDFKCSLGRMRPHIAFDVAKTVFLSDNRKILRLVKVPCTIIQSKNDFVVPISVAFDMGKKLGKNTKVEIMQTDGHLLMLTAHHLLLDVLKRVLGICG